MATRTRFVFLMHPKEYKQEKAGTGRLTQLCLENSEICVGVEFDDHERVQALIHDPANLPMLVYPGSEALNLSTGALKTEAIGERRLTLFLIDGTWALARKMLRVSPSLQTLPRLMFTPSAPSRFRIKQQPQEGLLSTLECTHELLLALEKSGLDSYSHPEQLLGLFERMQNYQIECAQDPNRASYRHRAYKTASERKGPTGESARRRRYIKL